MVFTVNMTIVSTGDRLRNLANLKGSANCLGFDVEPYHHVTLTVHTFQTKWRTTITILYLEEI